MATHGGRTLAATCGLWVSILRAPVAAGEEPEFQDIDNTLSTNCTSGPGVVATPQNSWNEGGCATGRDTGRWCVSPSGAWLECPADLCEGFLSCENVAAISWSQNHRVLQPEGDRSGLLVVFLPGSFGSAAGGYDRIMR